jgi:hypothetical protein
MPGYKFVVLRVWIVIFFAFLMLFIFGCAGPGQYQTRIISEERKNVRSYTIGNAITANVGNTMISRRSHTDILVDRWQGIQNGGWRREMDVDINPFREELVYLGLAGKTLRIGYREYSGGGNLIRPAFSQELTYDIGTSSVIVFRDFRIEVFGANNEGITFVVLKDGSVQPSKPKSEDQTLSNDPRQQH